MPTVKSLTKRVQFDFSPDAFIRLEELQAMTDASTKAEVVRNALKLYEWFIQQVNPRYTLTVEDEKGEDVFRIPASIFRS